jgi:transposase InsO family protein
MQISMQNAENLSQEEIRDFLESSSRIEITGEGRAEKYAFLQRLLVAQEYGSQKKKERGLIRAYARKMTGLSASQLTRLIRSYLELGTVEAKPYRRHKFPTTYTAEDVTLLAEVDRAHERLSGPATCCILRRAWERYADPRYERLAKLSVAHLYNLRRSAGYRKQAAVWEPTKPSGVSIAERRRPDPQGQPGFLRVDTVHQGDWNGAKGVYHINAVDTVTQWQAMGCVAHISEAYLMPALEDILGQFPFRVRGFHTDNGSEYINYPVAGLMKKLQVEFTKSRASRSQDNALVEGKNGAIIRKLIGYGHIPAEHAEAMHQFYKRHLNPYVNFHRPCGYATVSIDEKGKRKRDYPPQDYTTPYEKWKAMPEAASFLKRGQSFADLDRIAAQHSDTACAQQMSQAKAAVLRQCKIESPHPPRWK